MYAGETMGALPMPWFLKNTRSTLHNLKARKIGSMLWSICAYSWYARTVRAARWRLAHWYRPAMASGISALIRFAKRLKPYAAGIVASAHYPLSNCVLEGVNN